MTKREWLIKHGYEEKRRSMTTKYCKYIEVEDSDSAFYNYAILKIIDLTMNTFYLESREDFWDFSFYEKEMKEFNELYNQVKKDYETMLKECEK